MGFFTATADVASVLLSGGLSMAERLIMSGWDVGRIMDALRKKYTVIGGAPYSNQVYAAILNRANAALLGGLTLNAKRSNNPLSYEEHTGMLGISTDYQYAGVVRFQDLATGQEFTRPFYVGADVPLGKFDVLSLIRQQALSYAGGNADTMPGGESRELGIVGNPRITDALTRI
jgi:hypothetical protein